MEAATGPAKNLVGYCRVSKASKDFQPQIDELRKAGVEETNLYTGKVTGTRAPRPGLDASLAVLEPGDDLVVWRLDRLDRLGRALRRPHRYLRGLRPRHARASGRPCRVGCACGVLLVVAATVTGCGGSSDGGYQANPSSSVIAAGDSTGVGVPTEFPAILAIPKFDVTLVSASLLPLPGYPAPKLIHVGVWKITHGMAGMAWYWPPRETAWQRQPGVQSAPWVGGAPLAGNRLPPHAPARVIYYSVVASRPGDYYAAGLRIRYRVGGTVYTSNLYSGGAMCARVHWQAPAVASQCNVWTNQAFSKLADMAKGS